MPALRNAIWLCGTFLILPVGCSKNKTNELPPFNPKPGSLEFCIVANQVDDADAFNDAVTYFESAAESAELRAELKKRALAGQPPPELRSVDDVPFIVHGEKTSYRWVELGPNVIKEMRLDRDSESTPERETVAEARTGAQVAIIRLVRDGPFAIWSRPCINENLSNEQRAQKEFDFFILMRNSRPGKEITEAHLVEFNPTMDSNTSLPCIEGKLSDEGAMRMEELTRRNMPTEFYKRLMAIIIQGEILSMPIVQTVIRDRFMITGTFTREYVDEVVRKVRTAGQ